VFITSSLGCGFPDLVCGKGGTNYLIEIKDGSKPPSQRQLTKDELEFIGSFRGTVYVVECVEDVLKIQ
jgi:Holliday junction resolvase